MRETALVRDPEDARHLDLEGVGTVRFTDRLGRQLELSAPGRDPWRIRRPMFRGKTTITDSSGTTVATMAGDGVEHGGRAVRVATPETEGLFAKSPPFLLVEGERELARIDPRVWDEKPVAVTLLDEAFAAEEPQLLLLGSYCANLIASSRMARSMASATAQNP